MASGHRSGSGSALCFQDAPLSFDMAKLSFPLILRRVSASDPKKRLRPLPMLSQFLPPSWERYSWAFLNPWTYSSDEPAGSAFNSYALPPSPLPCSSHVFPPSVEINNPEVPKNIVSLSCGETARAPMPPRFGLDIMLHCVPPSVVFII